jgi:hypothetical protein
MKSIYIGQNKETNGQIEITPKMRQSTHMHVIGGSGKGKSKFLEWILRQDIKEGSGFCLIDWHGTLYQDVLRYCASLDVGLNNDFRKIILINPSDPQFVTGFNPFMNQGADIATQVNRRVDATIRPWGVTNTNQTPSFERLCKMLYTFAVEQRETLPNAAQLLSFSNKELRSYAAEMVSDSYIKRQWNDLEYLNKFQEWNNFALSTENRLSRFLTSKTIKRFLGLKNGNIDLHEAMDKGHIVLVNLGNSQYLDRESARVFASLFLNEFFETAMLRAQSVERGKKPKTFSLYLDEFQEYITDDIAAMLDQVRKGGLHMILAHQHLAHLADNKHLLSSILVNARIRAVFGGLTYDEAVLLANEMFLNDLNSRQIKQVYYSTIHLYDEQTRISKSKGIGLSEGENSNWTENKGSATTIGRSTSSSFGSGSGQSSSSSRSIGSSHSTSESEAGTYSIDDGLIFDNSEQLSESRGISEGDSDSVSESYGESFSSSEIHSEAESETLSETNSRSLSIGGGVNKSSSTNKSETESTVFVPIPVKQVTNEVEWSREEKASRIAELIKNQPQQHCFIKIDTERSQSLEVPFVKNPPVDDEMLNDYENEVYKEQGAIAGNEVDRILHESETEFFEIIKKSINSAPPENILMPNNKPIIDITPKKTLIKKESKNIFDRIKEANPDLDI